MKKETLKKDLPAELAAAAVLLLCILLVALIHLDPGS